jgi:glyoxylase I family protein
MSFNPLGIHHTAVIVSNMERSWIFYQNILKAVPVCTPSTFTFPDESKRVRWLMYGDTQQIHLMPGTPKPEETRHVALEVDDLNAFKSHLDENGIPYDLQMKIPGADRVYLRDPDNNLIEVMEWFTPWPDADPNPVPPAE